MSHYFTIIIPTRKISGFLLDETLPAIEKQSYRSFEVIVVSDVIGHDENKLKQKYPWLTIIHAGQKNRPGDKRDHAAKKAKGSVLAFIDDDVYPSEDWLQHAHNILHEQPEIAALGGPGMLAKHVNLWERIFDAVLRTWVGSGSYVYRFQPQSKRFVDDYPAMNLMLRKEIFESIGGFDNHHWPGEDSKLLNKFIVKEQRFILYHPDVQVYHHRRDTLIGHLAQHKNYGKTRGKFAAEGDQNSVHLMYIVPAVFTLYITCLTVFWIFRMPFVSLLAVPLYLYAGLLAYVFFETYLRSENLIIALGAIIVIPITHLTYGFWFVVGYVREKMKKFNRIGRL